MTLSDLERRRAIIFLVDFHNNAQRFDQNDEISYANTRRSSVFLGGQACPVLRGGRSVSKILGPIPTPKRFDVE